MADGEASKSSGAHRSSDNSSELTITDVPKAAGGLGAMRATLHHLRRDSGVLRGARALLHVNQDRGFDCPGCAWPEPKNRGVFEFCENGAKAVAEESTRKRATPRLFAEHSIAELRKLSDFELGQLGRITHPMVKRPGGQYYQPLTWEQLFAELGAAITSQGDPDKNVFYTSGRTSNEAAFLLQLMVRLLGTNNLPDCSNMCHESSGVGLNEVIGVGKGTVTLDDFEAAQAIFVIGQNPGTNHPRMLTTLREAARRGCRIVSINPLKEVGLARFSHPQKPTDLLLGGTPLAEEFVQVRIGGDIAFLKGMCKSLLERETPAIDEAFIRDYTSGFAEYRAALAKVSWDEITANSGIDREQIERIADLYASSERTIICWAMGLTQHVHAVANIQEVVNLLLLGGNLGKPGAGACPVRGHSNVQGDRSMGITSRPKPGFLDALEREFSFAPSRKPGLDTVEAISAMASGEATLFFAMGGNFYSASPDTAVVERALLRCSVTAHVSTKVNRSHLFPGETAYILPCLGRTELDMQDEGPQFVTVEDSMSMVHRSQGVLEPASEHLLSEPQIVARLAQTCVSHEAVNWSALASNYELIREHIARVVPGCEGYNQRIRTPSGFRMPNGASRRDFTATRDGCARFTVHQIPDLSLAEGRLRMMTLRSHDQYNTTVYGLDDRYRGVLGGRNVVLMNAQDIEDRGLVAGQEVDLVSEWDDGERWVRGFRVVEFDMPRETAATYFPEANPLVPLGARAHKSNTPASKSVVIRVVAASS